MAYCHEPTSLTLNDDREILAKYCDITVIVDEHKYPAHKRILSEWSPFFEKIFCVEMKSCCSYEIIIEGISKEVFEIILDFIYIGEVFINDELLHPCIEAADYLGLEYEVQTYY